jgi:hypothetical protein
MGRQKITIGPNDFETWGKLVKTWATGMDYLGHVPTEDNPVPTSDEVAVNNPKPRTFPEFWDQCHDAQIGLIFDDGNNTPVPREEGIGLIVLQGDSDVFVLRLPPYEILLEHQARVLNAGGYRFAPFYQRVFGSPPQASQMATKVQRMTIHAERVGEYTLNTCA